MTGNCWNEALKIVLNDKDFIINKSSLIHDPQLLQVMSL